MRTLGQEKNTRTEDKQAMITLQEIAVFNSLHGSLGAKLIF